VALVLLSHITVYHKKRHHISKEWSFFREVEEDNFENSVKQEHSAQKAPEQAVLVGSGANRLLLPAWELQLLGV